MADYTTAAKVKARLNISSETYDAMLAELVTSCSARIDRLVVGGQVLKTSSEKSFDVVHSRRLFLPPFTAIATFVDDGDTWAATDFLMYPRNKPDGFYLWVEPDPDGNYSAFSKGRDKVQVTADWGLTAEAATVPTAIQEACSAFVVWLFKRYQQALQDASANVELGELIYSDRIPKIVLDWLSPYLASNFVSAELYPS